MNGRNPVFAEGNHLPEQLLLKGDAAQGAANPPPALRLVPSYGISDRQRR